MSRPLEIISGDTYEYTVSSSDYPASDGWTLKVTYTNAEDFKQVDAATAEDGESYTVTLNSIDTGVLRAGVYNVVEAVQKGSGETLERHTLYSYQVTVTPNVSSAVSPVDTRSVAKQMLDLVNASLIASAGREMVSISTDGRMTQLRTWDEMYRMRARLMREVSDEDAKARAALGLATGRNILIKFV